MFSGENKSFNLKIGKLGLACFILGFAGLVFAAFHIGVTVGKDIDTYPEKAMEGLPGFVKKSVAIPSSVPVAANNNAVSNIKKEEIPPENSEDPASAETPKDKGETDLTFYDTLGGKKTQRNDLVSNHRMEKVEPAQDNSAKEKLKEVPEKTKKVEKEKLKKGNFFIQVISLKDKTKAEEIRKRLQKLGYRSDLDLRKAKDGSNLYRVKLVGFEKREDAAKMASAVEKKTQLKCLVLGK
jgi:cell division protein FtsN